MIGLHENAYVVIVVGNFVLAAEYRRIGVLVKFKRASLIHFYE